jgi:hypothetical protein
LRLEPGSEDGNHERCEGWALAQAPYAVAEVAEYVLGGQEETVRFIEALFRARHVAEFAPRLRIGICLAQALAPQPVGLHFKMCANLFGEIGLISAVPPHGLPLGLFRPKHAADGEDEPAPLAGFVREMLAARLGQFAEGLPRVDENKR